MLIAFAGSNIGGNAGVSLNYRFYATDGITLWHNEFQVAILLNVVET